MDDNPVRLMTSWLENGDMVIALYLEDMSLASTMEGIQFPPVAGL